MDHLLPKTLRSALWFLRNDIVPGSHCSCDVRVAHQAKRASVCLCQSECIGRSLHMHDAGMSADRADSGVIAGIARSRCSFVGSNPERRRSYLNRGSSFDSFYGRGCVPGDASVEIRKSSDVGTEYGEVAATHVFLEEVNVTLIDASIRASSSSQ